jgi:hypothetical protein
VTLMFRIITCRIALLSAALALPTAALACDGADCPAPSKPLDIQKFMREQAASTRGAEPHKRAASPIDATSAARPVKPKPRHTAATKIKSPPTETAAASHAPSTPASPAAASQSAFSNVPVVTEDQASATTPPPVPAPAYAPETVGVAPTANPAAADPNGNVKLVVADEFNEIDRKASDTALPGNGVHTSEMSASDAGKSWPRKVAGALGNVYGAFTGAVHKLTGF